MPSENTNANTESIPSDQRALKASAHRALDQIVVSYGHTDPIGHGYCIPVEVFKPVVGRVKTLIFKTLILPTHYNAPRLPLFHHDLSSFSS